MSQNEAFSRVVIDAQLADQGWNTQDSNSVRYEVVLEDGTRADYVLCDRHGRSLAVIEAKRFSVNPADAAEQAKNYARQLNVPYIFLTNGQEIRFWEWQREAFPHPVKTFFKQDIETVTEIFIRINSKGTVLSQADFVMSKIAADLRYGGQQLRKCIDYFCHLAVAPEFYGFIKDNDAEFAASPYFQKMAWLRNENDDLYDPSYNDLLRVAFTSEFGRGKLADLVSLLSGRNFETKNYEEAIAEASFAKLNEGVLDFINESHFKRFVMIIKSAGFITTEMIRTQGALNFAYIVYLRLRAQGIHDGQIESFVRRWFVMSVLTGRYSGSAETQFDQDIRQIASGDFADILAKVESAELSPAFWEVGLVQQLETSGTSSPYFWVFVAAQVRANDTGMLSKDITVRELVSHLGDIHHIFPRDLLKKAGLTRSQYNQIANYAYTQEEINIKIGNKPPRAYFADIQAQCSGGPMKYGAITDADTLKTNLAANCVPDSIVDMDVEQFDGFLKRRRELMAAKVRAYYEGL